MSVFELKFRRVIALATCLCFLISLFPEAQAALQSPNLQVALHGEAPRVSHIEIPTELATLDEVYESPLSNAKVVLQIQDAHANYEAQTNIKNLLKYLNKQYGFKIIFAEGAAEELDPKYLKLTADKKQNENLIDELARDGELSGAELYLLENGKEMRALPIEEIAAYRRNYLALRKVFGAEATAERYLSVLEKKMDLAVSKIFSPEMQSALKEWTRFENGQRAFLPYVTNLADLAKTNLDLDFDKVYSQIDWPQISRLLVLQKVEKELEQQASTAYSVPSTPLTRPLPCFGERYARYAVRVTNFQYFL